MKVVPVILCGGAGTRLWPLSRELYPKQLLALVDEHSLLQNTVLRTVAHPEVDDPLLVCNEEHRFLVAEQLRAIDCQSTILLEPEGRNTAPALALAANYLKERYKDEPVVLVVLPSDHVIPDQTAYHKALSEALKFAQENYLVTFGVTPQYPETGYGYVQKGDGLGEGFSVKQFVEKPDLSTAESYVASGDYFWNSGMFVFDAAGYLDALSTNKPNIFEACERASRFEADMDFVRVDAEVFTACPSDSIDYAVMEGADNAAMVPLDAGWSDVGSWDALWAVSEKDDSANTLIGDVISKDLNNSYIRAEHRLVSAVGLDDVIVVETADAVMVANKNKVQGVKDLVSILKSTDREERSLHRKVHRPWGTYEGVDSGAQFQVKRIAVNPGASLSLQLHNHRAEHWIVVSGTATVTCGDRVFELQTNESTYIPKLTKHRLQNLTDQPLEIIEVQSGDYLGEDDIVRFEDKYGR